MDKKAVLDIFHPIIKEWFEKNIGQPSPPQIEGWPAIQMGENVLIIAPTGSGKTLSAFMQCINDLFMQGIDGNLKDGVQVLYVSPLKALNNDIYRNLEMPIEGIRKICDKKGVSFPEISKAVRTGDTTEAERRRMLKKPPHILITTPESLFLMLTSTNSRRMLMGVKYIIIDEIHTLIDNKRGVHMALSVERLSHMVGKPLVRIGLSATVKPVEEAARYLGGFQRKGDAYLPRPVTIVQPFMGREVDLKIDMPVKDFRVIEDKTIWPSIYRKILELVKEHKSTLVFVNNRAVAEKVSANINSLSGKNIARAHHGCISRESRLEVERQLKSGELPCLVATSSLELGIDVGAIDLVIQVASPKSAARGLQRLGRAGHRLNSVSKGRIIPRTRGDLLESAVISMEMLNGNIEETTVPRNCLDILSQQLISMAVEKEWALDEIIDVVKSAYSFQTLKLEEMERVLFMLSGGYEHSEDSPRSPRLIWDSINKVVRGTEYSRMLSLGSGGTIPDRGYYGVYLKDGKTRLGELDEVFVFEARIGERFMLGASAWRIEEIRRDRVVVSPSGSGGAKTPFWTGDGLGRPYKLGVRFGSFLNEISNKAGTDEFVPYIMSRIPMDETAAANLNRYITDQKETLGCLPTDKRIVVEHFSDEVGEKRIVIHSMFGGRVNAGLAIALDHALSKALHCQVETSYNDDGVLIGIAGYTGHIENILSLILPDSVEGMLIESLPSTPLFSMTFRYNAVRALMMGMRRQGKRTQLWAQRLRALEELKIAEKYRDHPLIVETYRECMETVLDVPHLIDILNMIRAGGIQVVEKETGHPSPFTSELLFKFMGVMMYEGQMPDPVKPERSLISGKSSLNLNYSGKIAGNLAGRDTLLKVADRSNPFKQERKIKSEDELYNAMAICGDMAIEGGAVPEIENMVEGSVDSMLKSLKASGRVMELQLGEGAGRLIITSEEYPLYRPVAELSVTGNNCGVYEDASFTYEEALYRIIRRYARYNSPFSVQSVMRRYSVSEDEVEKALKRLEEDGFISRVNLGDGTGEEWCHNIVLDRARRYSMGILRKSVTSRDVHIYAGILPVWHGIGMEVVSPDEGLYDVIGKLHGLYLPPEWWEDFIFPSRIPGYRKNYLDKLCSTGRVVWRIRHDEDSPNSPRLAWYRVEDLNEAEGDGRPKGLNEREKLIYDILNRRGASFTHMLSAASRMETDELIGTLEAMVWKGMIVNDSFESIRYFLSVNPKNSRMKALRRVAVFSMDIGRWDISRKIENETLNDYLMTLFDRYGLISKEVFQCEKPGYPWGEAYEVLKQWEYTGKVNRGYYVKGLSGMQFMLSGAASLPERGEDKFLVIDSCDPAQVYGRIASHTMNEVPWSCVPGTAVVLKSGRPVLIVECFGERFMPASENRSDVKQGIAAFADAFISGRIWALEKRIKVRQWQDNTPSKCEFSEELCAAGFEREMQDMVLWK